MENPFALLEEKSHLPSPAILVIFGATGDLTKKKLMPALYNLAKTGALPAHFAVAAFARKPKDDAIFRQEMKESIEKHADMQAWDSFEKHLFYHRASFEEDAGFISFKQRLAHIDSLMGTKGNLIYYLATPPSYFAHILEKLSKHGLLKKSRVIIEKPFGHDLESAKILQQDIEKYLLEKQIYRIDHYLGKETVQNILAFRLSNPIFEAVWNNTFVDHIEITVSELIGTGSRGAFLDKTGTLRDMIQNHMMQLLALTTMDLPPCLSSSAIRKNKIKLMQTILPIEKIVRGQYEAGWIDGQKVVGYKQEDLVNPQSQTETYVALEANLNTPRWKGVPIYLRTGKRLPKRTAEIALQFKKDPRLKHCQPNVLAIQIQPNAGISVKINSKVPGHGMIIQPMKMDFCYASYFGKETSDAYERLLLDCFKGDQTLFASIEEVLAAWKLFTPVLDRWKDDHTIPQYPSGSWGPKEAEKIHSKWRFL